MFRANDTALRREVALKLLRPRLNASPSAVRRFLREAQTAAAIQHDNVVTIYSVGEAQGIPFLAQELLSGETLESRLRREATCSADDSLRIGREIALGLAAAHAGGVLHRDIKPANIWLQSLGGRVKILDFGLARPSQANEGLTQSGTVLGTPAYMSPEQASGEPLDERSDLFSLGCVLYRMVTGRFPFEGLNTFALLQSLAATDPPRARTIVPSIPIGLSEVIAELLSKDRIGRPDSALRVVERLDSISLERESLPAVTTLPQHISRSHTRIASLPWGAALLLLCGAILVRITHQDDSTTELRVSDAKRVELSIANESTPAANRAPVVASAGWYGWPDDAPQPALVPFDAAQAREHQEAWAKYLNVPLQYTNSLGMTLRLIPPGEFEMGAADEELRPRLGRTELPSDAIILSVPPRRRVILTQPFYLGTLEVIQRDFQPFMGHPSSNNRHHPGVSSNDLPKYPVDSVTWVDAAHFCQQLSRHEQLSPAYFRTNHPAHVTILISDGYRLPTEAQWEYACRAGSPGMFSVGDSVVALKQTAWFIETAGVRQGPHPGGELLPNAFGLFDMHGNVAEWCQDGWSVDADSRFQNIPAVDPQGPQDADQQRVVRGGSVDSPAEQCAAAYRRDDSIDRATGADLRGSLTGFRLTLSVSAVRSLIASAATPADAAIPANSR